MCLAVRGASISQYLSSHKDPVPTDEPVEPAFSEEQDQLILELHARYGNRWTQMARDLADRGHHCSAEDFSLLYMICSRKAIAPAARFSCGLWHSAPRRATIRGNYPAPKGPDRKEAIP